MYMSMTANSPESCGFFSRAFRRLVVEDAGDDMTEYGLLTGIVIAVVFLVFVSIHTAMGTAYGTWGTAIMGNWQPSPPSGP